MYLDISAYYLHRWKLGYYPPIVRDTLYLTHRVQPTTGVTYTGPQTTFIPTTARGSTPTKNDVEVLCFLTGAASVDLTIGGLTTTFNAPAAGLYSFKAPLRNGTVMATAKRAGQTVASVTSPWPISSTQWGQDFGYRAVSSRR